MRKPKIIFLFFIVFFSLRCVETLITVRVFPDGKYHMKYHTQGDRKDVFNQDFPIPMQSPWAAEIIEKRKEGDDEPVHIINSEALLSGTTTFFSETDGPAPPRHPITVQKNDQLFSTRYTVRQLFQGRRVHQKYPLLAKAMQDAVEDSSDKIVETEIIMYCLQAGISDLQDRLPIKDLLKERILNHFRGVFHKAEEEENLFGIMDKENKQDLFALPKELIETNFRPFLADLPKNFTQECMDAMAPYIDEANVTVNLNDDTFKFVGILPGVITRTNADSIFNDTLLWIFNYEDFLNDDYIIEAASIIYHPKRIQIAIVIGALAALVGLISISRRRRIS